MKRTAPVTLRLFAARGFAPITLKRRRPAPLGRGSARPAAPVGAAGGRYLACVTVDQLKSVLGMPVSFSIIAAIMPPTR